MDHGKHDPSPQGHSGRVCISRGRTLHFQNGATAAPGSGLIRFSSPDEKRAYHERVIAERAALRPNWEREFPDNARRIFKVRLEHWWAAWIDDRIDACRCQFFALKKRVVQLEQRGMPRKETLAELKRWGLG